MTTTWFLRNRKSTGLTTLGTVYAWTYAYVDFETSENLSPPNRIVTVAPHTPRDWGRLSSSLFYLTVSTSGASSVPTCVRRCPAKRFELALMSSV
jgi:hypothetical protein